MPLWGARKSVIQNQRASYKEPGTLGPVKKIDQANFRNGRKHILWDSSIE